MISGKPWDGADLPGLGIGPGNTSREALVPTRRDMELIIIVVVLLHPVIRMAHIWAAKHLATSANPATGTVAEVVATVV